MAITGVIERADISATRRFGEAPKFQRKFLVEVSNPAFPPTLIVNATPVRFLDQHPEAYYCRAMNVAVANYGGSRFHYEVTWDYELPRQSEEDLDPNPLARRDIWRWSTGGLTVPALYYYDGGTLKALTNSANDFFEGATTDISTLQAAISANRPNFDYSLAQAVTNSVNSDTYLGGDAHTWKCSGISGQPAVEVVNEVEIRYWQIETTLEFRPDGWDLQLPDVGFNFLEGGTKKRAYVIDSETGDQVPSSNPQPLNTDGTLKTGAPDILVRQVQREVAFAGFFGEPS